MTEHAPDRIWSGIEISKVAAGTLAAVSAAVIGSFLGVAGTLIGAAVASVISTVGTEVYQRSIHKGAKKLQTIAPTFITSPAAVGTPGVAAATEEDAPSHAVAPDDVTAKRAADQSGFKLRWKPILIGSVAVFVVAMGAIFAAEAVAGRSLASISGHDDSGRSTIGVPVGNREKSTPTPAPSGASTETGTTTPASEAPAADPTDQATTNAPQNTQAPTDAPQPTPPGAEQNEQQNDQQPRDDQQQVPDQGSTE